MRHWTVIWLALSPAVLFAQQPQQQPAPFPAMTFVDQFDKTHATAEWRGKVVVVLYGDRQSAEANRALGTALHDKFAASAKDAPRTGAEVLAVPVASVGKVPSLIALMIKRQIRSASPEMPVFLDFQDQLKNQFGLAAGVPNVVVVDRVGRVRFTVTGTPTAEQFGQLTSLLETLRRE